MRKMLSIIDPSWVDLPRAAVFAAGDGALRYWNVQREVLPETTEGGCWFRKTANVLAALPKSARPGAKKALAEIWGAEDKQDALRRSQGVPGRLGREVSKAAAKITDDLDQLLAFYDYLRTTNRIEFTFDTVRRRAKITCGPGSRAAGVAMAFKLIQAARDRWRAVNAPRLVALVRADADFVNNANSSNDLATRPGQKRRKILVHRS